MKLNLAVNPHTFEEILTKFGNLEIPDFQRPYEWKSEQWSALWNDILENLDTDYLMGGVVLCGNDSGTEFVIDGQQRISTITLFIAACRDYLYEEIASEDARDLADELHKGFVVSGGKLDKKNEPYIILSEVDRIWFGKHIQCSPKSSGEFSPPGAKVSYNLPSSVRLLWKAYRYFYIELKKRHSENLAFPSEESVIADITRITRQLAKNIWFVVSRVPDDNQAYILFEVLNDRGLELSISDLIKNRILSHAASLKKLDKAKETWSEIVDTLDHENVAAFIRYYWMSQNGKKITEKNLFPVLKKEIKDKNAATFMAFLKKLSEEADAFSEIIGRPKSKTNAKIQRELSLVNSYGFRVGHTVLLAIWSASKDEKTRLLVIRSIKNFLVKYAIFGNQVTNKLESVLAEIALAIRKDLSSGLSTMSERLKKTLPPNDIIKSGFSVLEPSIPVARALLTEIELHLAGKEKTPGGSDQVHVEHIFPQSPNASWLKAFGAEKGAEETFMSRLGNMTLLDELLNKGCGNKSFETKQTEYYANSDFTITKQLLSLANWTAKSVETRQSQLYKYAAKIWDIE